MTKARALKRRYVLFELRGPDLDEPALKRAIYAEALSFFGELGLSHAALKLVSYDNKTRRGILRCERDYLERALGFLALVSALGGAQARLVALESSGTLHGLVAEATHAK